MHLSRLYHHIAILFLLLSTFATFQTTTQAAEPLRIGSNFLPSGLDPSSLDPTKGSNGWSLVSYGVGENLFTIDENGQLVPELAQSAHRESEFVWVITLQKGRLFADGTAVTARALASGFDNTMEKTPIAHATGGRLHFEAMDDLTLRVTTQKPVPLLQALFAEWPMIAYKLNDQGKPVYTGPYNLHEFKPDSYMTLQPNLYFFGAASRSPVIIRRFGDAQSMALAFEAGELDLAFGLPSELANRLSHNPDLTIKSFLVGYQYMAFLNTKLPPLDDVRLRQAIDLAIDREELITMLGGGQVATGAYAPYFPFASAIPRSTDLKRAETLLDEAGWRKNTDNIREKDGQKLQLLMATYTARSDLVNMLPVIRAQLARIGINVNTQIFENIPQMDATQEINISVRAQHTAPSGDESFVMNSMFRTGAPLNHARYESPEFDAISDRFSLSANAKERALFTHYAHEKLFKDAPVSFLVSPVWYVGLSKRLENYQPWGSDYHILRAEIGEKISE